VATVERQARGVLASECEDKRIATASSSRNVPSERCEARERHRPRPVPPRSARVLNAPAAGAKPATAERAVEGGRVDEVPLRGNLAVTLHFEGAAAVVESHNVRQVVAGGAHCAPPVGWDCDAIFLHARMPLAR